MCSGDFTPIPTRWNEGKGHACCYESAATWSKLRFRVEISAAAGSCDGGYVVKSIDNYFEIVLK